MTGREKEGEKVDYNKTHAVLYITHAHKGTLKHEKIERHKTRTLQNINKIITSGYAYGIIIHLLSFPILYTKL